MLLKLYISDSVRNEMFQRMIDEEHLKTQKQSVFGPFFLKKANRFKPKSRCWIHLCL
jgi:hypothetical protein